MVQSGAGRASWHEASEPEQKEEGIHLPGKGNLSPNKVSKASVSGWLTASCQNLGSITRVRKLSRGEQPSQDYQSSGRVKKRATENWVLPLWLTVKESTCNAGDVGSIPGSGRSPGEGIGYPFQYSCTSLVAQLEKTPSVMLETWVWSLGWEDSLEKWIAIHFRFWPGEFHGL